MRKFSIILLVIYTVLTTYSIVSRFFGIAYLPIITPLLTILAFGFGVLHGWQRLGWRQMLLLLALTFGVSLLFECVGVATGLIYGDYHYTDKLGYKFLGLVPLLIPLAWFMMTYPAYIITIRLAPETRNTWAWRLWVAVIGAVVMTAWDLAMDPMMVAGGHWVWDEPGAYFGVPIQNYWGWLLTIFVTFLLFLWLSRQKPGIQPIADASLRDLDRLAVLSYAIVGMSTVVVDFQSGLDGPGLVGLFAMLPWIVLGWNSKAG